MDQFKKYIREHRDKLDMEQPPSFNSWPLQSPGPNFISRPLFKWLAAASIITIVSVMLFWFMRESPVRLPNEVSIATNDSVSNIPDPVVVPDSSGDERAIAVIPESKPEIKERQRKVSPVANTATTHRKRKETPSPFQSLETNYATIISYQLRRLERTPIYAESADYFHVFKKQWYDLGKDEEKLKQDIQVYGLNDIIVDQLIQLYQNKISVLKQLQTEINKMNLRTRNHPEFRNQPPSYLKM